MTHIRAERLDGPARPLALPWGKGPHGKMPAMGLDHYMRDRVAIGMLNRAQLKRLLVEAINRLEDRDRLTVVGAEPVRLQENTFFTEGGSKKV